MRVFCSGFNLYGQFVNCPSSVVEAFIDCQYDGATDLELSHTFLVVVQENRVFVHGAKGEQTHQIQKIAAPDQLCIQQTACSDARVIFLCSNGALLKLDFNKNPTLEPTLMPNLVFNEPNESVQDQIIKIACGSKICIALSREGKLFNLPNKLRYESTNVLDVCTGSEHCLILDNEGNVYTFGRGSRGQLGHGNLEDEPEPVLVQALAGIKVSKIAAGSWHSCALSAEGDLYTWGWNSNGQLGLSRTEEGVVSVMASPHVVDFDEGDSTDANVIAVACGNRHTVALLDNGKLYGAGWNKYHQLGNLNCQSENFCAMTLLHDFSTLKVAQLKCGPWSTAVIIN